MTERKWKFSMTPQHGPMWDLYENDSLVAYARRAEDGGWYVRLREYNPSPDTEKIYIGDDVCPVDFMNIMLGLYKEETP